MENPLVKFVEFDKHKEVTEWEGKDEKSGEWKEFQNQ